MTEGLAETFPPPRSMEALPNNLPVQTTSFVGREKQLEEVKHLLANARHLTLLGTGGTGKTRLALETGAQVIHDFRDGVWLVELALIAEADRVVEAVAAAVGAREEPDRPLHATLINFLRGKTTLVLLDNCEHLLSAVAALAAELLRSCPRLKILATSRHALRIGGEAIFRVPPLQMLDVDPEELGEEELAKQLPQYEAVKLFVARAVAVRSDFTITNANAPAIAEICSRLDGIPQPLNSRRRGQAAQCGTDRRGSTIVSVCCAAGVGWSSTSADLRPIDWSHDLLSENERIAFRRMGSSPAAVYSKLSRRFVREMASRSSRCSTC